MSAQEINLMPLLACLQERHPDLYEALRKESPMDLEKIVINKGGPLFKQGDKADALYIVIKGLLQASVAQETGQHVELSTMGPGELVGEIGLIVGGEHSAHVRAVEDTEVIKLPQATFEKVLGKYPDVINKIIAIIRQRLRRSQLVAILPKLFGKLDDRMIKDIETHGEWISLKGDEFLFRKGDAGDDMYIVVNGRLRAVTEDESGNERVLNELERSESIGEMALITGEARTASVYAIRDSELVKFSKPVFEQIVTKYPGVMKSISLILIDRLRKSEGILSKIGTAINVTLVPTHADVPLSDFAGRLAAALSHFGPTLHLSSLRLSNLLGLRMIDKYSQDDLLSNRLAVWLDEQETNYRFIVYEADGSSSAWTAQCLRQADQILIIAKAQSTPALGGIETELLHPNKRKTSARQTLVLIHPDGSQLPSGTVHWLAERHVGAHLHLRWNTNDDFGRLARMLSGCAVGLVLGGGGARGFAHIGVIRALKEAGVPIDLVGGTSMGSIISAEQALGWDHETMLSVNRENFIKEKPLRDYTLPLLSLIRGRKFDALAKKVFGEFYIEDLWIDYFSVSSNLTTSEMTILRKGPLWKAVRASSSLPGVFPPFLHGTNLLVDGAILNNLPGDVMRNLATGPIIVSDVSPHKDLSFDRQEFPSPWKVLRRKLSPFKKSIKTPNIMDILMRTAEISSDYRATVAERTADLYLRLPVEQYMLLEFKALEKAAESGYQYTKKKIKNIQNEPAFQTILAAAKARP
jgi:predicted acylesterase/phospholipase RssA/CRP-like cAMP-binding protein